MKLLKLSASAVQSADGCLARFQAQQVGYGGEIKNDAAMIGTAVHGALEMYVQNTVQANNAPRDFDTLSIYYRKSFRDTFGTSDTERPEYADGLMLCKAWYERSVDSTVTEDWSEFTVISTEKKDTFQLPTSIGDIPFNYIWDRFDYMGDGVYRVVDYKTNRAPESAESLHKKIQALVYAIAAAIQLGAQGVDFKKIYVGFDMLRHNGLVETSFIRDELVKGWDFLIDTAERIIATPDTDPKTNEPIVAPETLNDMCNFCVRKSSCSEMRKNIAMGGVFASANLEELVELRALIKIQADANKKSVEELDRLIKAQMENDDIIATDTPLVNVQLKSSNYRTVDSSKLFHVIGEELFDFYGGFSINMGKVDEMLKNDMLTEDQKAAVRNLIRKSPGAPRVDTKLKNGLTK